MWGLMMDTSIDWESPSRWGLPRYNSTKNSQHRSESSAAFHDYWTPDQPAKIATKNSYDMMPQIIDRVSMRFGARVGMAITSVMSMALSGAAAMAASPAAGQMHQTLRVGSNRQFVLPSVAAQFARDGDTIEIDAGTYDRDVAVWKQNNLTIRGAGGIAHMAAHGAAAQGKGIWIFRGDNVTVENIELSGASVADRNGAAIRLEGTGLTVRHSYFHDNENGILCGGNPRAEVVVENSEFERNGHGDGQSHNIYCGRIKSLTMRSNYIHHARVGHNIKSRAARNLILYNRIADESDGNASYAIDLPNGGISIVLGNIVQKGPLAENRTLISYGAEGYGQADNSLYVVNNTLIDEKPGAGRFIFVRDGATSVSVINNLYAGAGNLLVGAGFAKGNLAANSGDFRDMKGGDYRLDKRSKAIQAGVPPGITADGYSLTPTHEYQHNATSRPRADSRRLDIGALAAE